MPLRPLLAFFISLSAAALCAFDANAAAPSPAAGSKVAPAGAPTPITAKVCPARKDSYPANYNLALDSLGLDELTKLADRGDADALVLLGLMYAPSPDRNAKSPPEDIDKALKLFERAAKKGHGFGAYFVGVAHANGAGVPKDDKKAVEWFRRSADRGTALAVFWLGEMIAKGRGGFKSDWKAALPYFTRAAAGGVPDAYAELGYAFDKGEGGLVQSTESAAYCFRQGSPKSITAQFNLRLMIDQGRVQWQPGDPGVAPTPEK